MIERDMRKIIKSLNQNGITSFEVSYDGGNDDGCFDDLTFYKNKKKVNVNWNEVMNLSDDEDYSDDEFLADIYSDYGRLNPYYSFAGEYTVHGKITVDTVTGEIDNEGEQSTWQGISEKSNLFTTEKELF
jgi:hypothetical protein